MRAETKRLVSLSSHALTMPSEKEEDKVSEAEGRAKLNELKGIANLAK